MTAPIQPSILSTLPTPPDPYDSTTFDTRAYAWLLAQQTMKAELDVTNDIIYNNALSAFNDATIATLRLADTIAASGIALFVGGTSYVVGNLVYSPVTLQAFRCSVNTSSATDPSLSSNWIPAIDIKSYWTVITTNTTLKDKDCIMANTTAASFTLTLPSTPNANDVIKIADYAGTFGIRPITVARSLKNIMGLAEHLILNMSNASITLTYIDATKGWKII